MMTRGGSGNADHQRREEDRTDRELQDDPDVGAKIPPRGEPGARHQQRRQKQHQHQVGIKLDIRRTGDHGKADPAQNQRRRARQLKPSRDQVEHHNDGHQQQDQFETGNGGHAGLLMQGMLVLSAREMMHVRKRTLFLANVSHAVQAGQIAELPRRSSPSLAGRVAGQPSPQVGGGDSSASQSNKIKGRP
jgi:hypothetical protein